jgi:DNA-binding transcriptional LysR family regulator
MDKWAELRTAYQVAKLGTVSAAAEALGFHRATVNRHIDVLEADIGVRIFIRHARDYALTEIGEDVLRVVQKTESLIDDLAGCVQGRKTQIDGEIKLTILAPFASLLMGQVADFRDQNLHGVAEFERSIMLERQREGIAKAKAEGKYKGRSPTAKAKAKEVLAMHAEGVGATAIAKQLNIGRASVYRILAD